MNRVVRVARIHLTNWVGSIGWPLVILAVAFAVNLVLFSSTGDLIPVDSRITGGLASIYIVQLILCWQAMNQLFSFAVGLNVTRRTFYAGTGLVVLAQSFGFAVLLYLAELVEHATDDWGGTVAFFDPLPVTHGNSPVHILVYAVPMLLVSFVGLFLGTVNKRWGSNGVYALTLPAALVAVLLSWLVGWPAVGRWLTTQSEFGLLVGWALVPVVLFGGGAYRLLRRAVP